MILWDLREDWRIIYRLTDVKKSHSESDLFEVKPQQGNSCSRVAGWSTLLRGPVLVTKHGQKHGSIHCILQCIVMVPPKEITTTTTTTTTTRPLTARRNDIIVSWSNYVPITANTAWIWMRQFLPQISQQQSIALFDSILDLMQKRLWKWFR